MSGSISDGNRLETLTPTTSSQPSVHQIHGKRNGTMN
jgi:hypothetical protein